MPRITNSCKFTGTVHTLIEPIKDYADMSQFFFEVKNKDGRKDYLPIICNAEQTEFIKKHNIKRGSDITLSGELRTYDNEDGKYFNIYVTKIALNS